MRRFESCRGHSPQGAGDGLSAPSPCDCLPADGAAGSSETTFDRRQSSDDSCHARRRIGGHRPNPGSIDRTRRHGADQPGPVACSARAWAGPSTLRVRSRGIPGRRRRRPCWEFVGLTTIDGRCASPRGARWSTSAGRCADNSAVPGPGGHQKGVQDWVDEVKGKGKDHEVRKKVQEEFWTTPFGLTFNKKEEVLTALNERTALLRVVRDAQQTAGIPNWGSGGPTKQVTVSPPRSHAFGRVSQLLKHISRALFTPLGLLTSTKEVEAMYCRGRLILASNDPTAADEFKSAVIGKGCEGLKRGSAIRRTGHQTLQCCRAEDDTLCHCDCVTETQPCCQR